MAGRGGFDKVTRKGLHSYVEQRVDEKLDREDAQAEAGRGARKRGRPKQNEEHRAALIRWPMLLDSRNTECATERTRYNKTLEYEALTLLGFFVAMEQAPGVSTWKYNRLFRIGIGTGRMNERFRQGVLVELGRLARQAGAGKAIAEAKWLLETYGKPGRKLSTSEMVLDLRHRRLAEHSAQGASHRKRGAGAAALCAKLMKVVELHRRAHPDDSDQIIADGILNCFSAVEDKGSC